MTQCTLFRFWDIASTRHFSVHVVKGMIGTLPSPPFLFNNVLIQYLHHFNDYKYFILWVYLLYILKIFLKLTHSLRFLDHLLNSPTRKIPKPNKINTQKWNCWAKGFLEVMDKNYDTVFQRDCTKLYSYHYHIRILPPLAYLCFFQRSLYSQHRPLRSRIEFFTD